MTEPPAPDSSAPTDNLYSPANYAFYAHQHYKPLDKYSHMIRLLAVTKDESVWLQCRLKDATPLEDADGTYTAISYCAGDPKETRTVQVYGKPFNSFANLAHGIEEIYRYRSTEHGDIEALLWTDQVCINQNDASERSHQVNFMNKIYGCAREVAICLSTEGEPGGPVLGWLQEVHDHMMSTRPNEFGTLTAQASSEGPYVYRYFSGILKSINDYICSVLDDDSVQKTFFDMKTLFKQP